MRIDPSETEIVGDSIIVDGRADNDDATKRIYELVANHLIRLGVDWSGWETLFQDPDDQRLWEHTYPKSYMHGGGPPALKQIGTEAAREKYPDAMKGM